MSELKSRWPNEDYERAMMVTDVRARDTMWQSGMKVPRYKDRKEREADQKQKEQWEADHKKELGKFSMSFFCRD